MIEPVHTTRLVLDTVDFDVVWERLRLGPTPVALRVRSPGRTHAERREIVAAGWEGLRARGLAGPSGPHPELVRLLHLLARPSRQVELRAWWGSSVRAVAAGHPGTGVLAVRRESTVVLEPCGSLPTALLGVLPAAPAGPGRATTLPTAVLTAALAARGEAGLRAALVARDLPPADAGLLTRMLEGAERRAQIVALATDRWGVLRRLPRVVGVLEATRGRYLLTRTTTEDGVEWSTVTPTDDRRLRHRVGELLDEAAAVAAAEP
ncbi:MAG TPA: ESX secretion-associated protein EspG [Pseudonocardia sp.]|nr:ESX secretion-associated protein EspG [Pseudonocardia sp.]